jgi:hypothetical protein
MGAIGPQGPGQDRLLVCRLWQTVPDLLQVLAELGHRVRLEMDLAVGGMLQLRQPSPGDLEADVEDLGAAAGALLDDQDQVGSKAAGRVVPGFDVHSSLLQVETRERSSRRSIDVSLPWLAPLLCVPLVVRYRFPS